MVRSPRTQRALLLVFAALLVASGAAFASTATAQLAWQERDTIDFQPTRFDLVDGEEPTLRVAFTVRNPTGVDARVRPDAIVAYDGDPRAGETLSVPRTARLAGDREATVPAGGTATVTVVADVPAERTERTREAIDAGRIVASGSFTLTIRGRSDTADV